MSKDPPILIVASFSEEKTARNAFFDLKMDKRGRLIKFRDAAIVSKDEDDKLDIKETGDMSGGKGALYGGGIGALIGLIFGPLEAAIGGVAGAVVGGIVATKIDAGIPDDRLMEFTAELEPGSSVIMVIVEQRWLEDVHIRLEEAGGELLTETINEQIFDQE